MYDSSYPMVAYKMVRAKINVILDELNSFAREQIPEQTKIQGRILERLGEDEINFLSNLAKHAAINYDLKDLFFYYDDLCKRKLRNLHFKTFGISDVLLRRIFDKTIHAEHRNTPEDRASNGYIMYKQIVGLEKIIKIKEICEYSSLMFVNTHSSSNATGVSLTEAWNTHNLDAGSLGRNNITIYKHGQWLSSPTLNQITLDIFNQIIRTPNFENECEQLIDLSISYPLNIIDINLMYTFPGSKAKDAMSHAMEYHVDHSGPAFCKLFITITPLNTINGTHSFLKGSHIIKPPYYKDCGYNLYTLLDYYSKDSFVDFVMAPGDCLMENTTGYHCGKAGQKPRILLVITVAKLFGK